MYEIAINKIKLFNLISLALANTRDVVHQLGSVVKELMLRAKFRSGEVKIAIIKDVKNSNLDWIIHNLLKMFWMCPEKKYNQTVFTCYDASEPSHFCQRGENWGAFSADECDRIISLSQNVATAQNYIVEVTNPSYRQVSAWEISQTQETNWVWQRLINNVISANNYWWNYELVGILEPIQLICYDSTNTSDQIPDNCDLHIDNEYPLSFRKISFSVELSDPNSYEGGKLSLYVQKDPKILPRGRGTMIMFPSFILHEVTPIIQGKRWAVIGWVGGPQFR